MEDEKRKKEDDFTLTLVFYKKRGNNIPSL